MRITFQLESDAPSRIGGQVMTPTARRILWLLEALIKCNMELMKVQTFPLIYSAGVRYRPERAKEIWLDIPSILKLGHGDCEDLACWRIAELRNQGTRAKAYLRWAQDGPMTVYHVLVAVNSHLEDPSKILGMEGDY